MLITVITINLNNADGLRKTLESVEAQHYHDYEHIIVDGGSSDGSVDLIRHYAATKGNVTWISEPDSGVYCAMNKGIGLAHGDYLNFMNSGDYYHDADVLHQVAQSLDSPVRPQVLVGKTRVVNPDGSPDALRVGWTDFEIHTLGDLMAHNYNHQSTFYASSLFAKYGNYDERYRILSDWKLNLTLMIDGIGPEYVPYDVACFDNSGISTTQPDLFDQEKVLIMSELLAPTVLQDYKWLLNWKWKITAIQKHPMPKALLSATLRLLYWIERRNCK